MKRRTIVKAAGFGLAGAFAGLPAMAQDEFGSKELIAAAEKEGQLTYYTANFAEVEQEVIKEFNKRFPKIKVAMVRAPGRPADHPHQDRGGGRQARRRRGQPLRPRPDAGDRRPLPGLRAAQRRRLPARRPGRRRSCGRAPRSAGRSPTTPQLVKNPPKTWMDLTKPEYKDKQIGQVVGPSGGTTWTRVMFERQVLGEDYWQKQAALGVVLFPSGAPTSDSLVRGEISIAPLLYNIIYTKIVDGAPAEAIFAPEGVPINPLRRRHSQDGARIPTPPSCS